MTSLREVAHLAGQQKGLHSTDTASIAIASGTAGFVHDSRKDKPRQELLSRLVEAWLGLAAVLEHVGADVDAAEKRALETELLYADRPRDANTVAESLVALEQRAEQLDENETFTPKHIDLMIDNLAYLGWSAEIALDDIWRICSNTLEESDE